MELAEEKKRAVEQWVKEGCGLSEIQARLADQFGVKMTFMDVRLLMIELGLDVKEKQAARPDTVIEDSGPPDVPAEPLAEPGPAGATGVSVEIDRVTKPNSVVSGTVTFSDGVEASWSLDQFGRLAIQADTPGYRPSEQDVGSFQQELQGALQKRGF